MNEARLSFLAANTASRSLPKYRISPDIVSGAGAEELKVLEQLRD